MSNIPGNLKYTKTHEWVKIDGNKAVLGITDHAQHELTDIVFVDLPEVGKKVSKGAVALVVESVKVAADIYSPVDGKVSKVNSNLIEHPELINNAPYGEGYLIEIETQGDAQDLLDAKAYGSMVE
ncbi:MAG: hypothetical protein ACD_79C00393G0003 [uncultured bacterium]|nr:MAG: hypothetical protein ACD_79C00393G0003 [uncultured bacterium]